MIKVLHLNALNIGGAAKAAERINSSLQSKIQSEIFYFKDKQNFIKNLISKPYSVLDKILSNPKNKPLNSTFSSNRTPFSYIPTLIKIKNPDIVNLHWINAGMMSVTDLLRINKPIVWTMHDYWPFSGGYHYPENETLTKDPLNKNIFELKKKVYHKIKNLNFVAVSKNLMDEAKKSELLKNKSLLFINNPLNNKIFDTNDKLINKRKINLDDKLSILFCSNNSILKKNKNFAFLVNVLNKFSLEKKFNLIICGENRSIKNIFQFSKNINLIETGYIDSEKEISEIYSAADITAIPSVNEAFGQTASESCASGTPVVALNNTGLNDILIHKENGYLCNEYNVENFIDGINWLSKQNYKFLEKKCKESVSKFSYHNISNQYIRLYEEILKKKI